MVRNSQNLSRYVYEELRARILDGRLPVGASIIEREIGAELEVSRVPIREALPMLESAGLVALSPRRPAVVAPVTRTGVDQLYDIRAVLEPFIARQAAAAVSVGADPAALRSALMAADAALREQDWLTFHELSAQVHMEIERLADNALFVAVMEPLRERNNRLNVANMRTDPMARHSEHSIIVESIVCGQPDLASAISFSHVEWGRARILQTLESVPGYDPDR